MVGAGRPGSPHRRTGRHGALGPVGRRSTWSRHPAGLGGVLSTACTAAVPSLVTARQLLAAYASMQVIDQVGMVAAPALSGLLIGRYQLPWVDALVAVIYLVAA